MAKLLEIQDLQTLFYTSAGTVKAVDEISYDVEEGETVAIVGAERVFKFSVDPALKQKMLSGMDDIDLTLAERSMIEVFEQQHRSRQPWLFRDG